MTVVVRQTVTMKLHVNSTTRALHSATFSDMVNLKGL